MKKTLGRRHFLKVAGAGMAGAALIGGAGCAGAPEMNVVLIIIDSLRKDHVGAYGNSWIKTPSLDAFARESLRFTQSLPRVAAHDLRAARDPHGVQDLPV